MNVAYVKTRRIDEDVIAFFSRVLEPPQRRFCERVAYCQTLVGIVCRCAKVVVGRNQQDARAGAIESNDSAPAELAAIETDVVRSDSRGERLDVEKLSVPLIDLEPDLPG